MTTLGNNVTKPQDKETKLIPQFENGAARKKERARFKKKNKKIT